MSHPKAAVQNHMTKFDENGMNAPIVVGQPEN